MVRVAGIETIHNHHSVINPPMMLRKVAIHSGNKSGQCSPLAPATTRVSLGSQSPDSITVAQFCAMLLTVPGGLCVIVGRDGFLFSLVTGVVVLQGVVRCGTE